MHVAINAVSITNRSGTGRYSWGIIHGFVQQKFSDIELSVLIPADFSIPQEWYGCSNIRFYSIAIRSAFHRILWEQIFLPERLNSLNPDIFHSPAFVAPVLRKIKARHVVTVHDLAFQKYSHTIPHMRRWYYPWFISHSLQLADMIITDSKFIADEINSLNITQSPIVPVHLAVDKEKFHPNTNPEDRAILDQYQLDSPYFLIVGTIEPRKNLSTILSAFQSALGSGLDADLVLAGRLGWMHTSAELAAHRVKKTGFVPEEHLPAFYRHAKALIAPSIYEGFDLPAVESIACGTPVLASSIPVHHEILGEKAVYVETLNESRWKEAFLDFNQETKMTINDIGRDWADVARDLYHYYSNILH